MSKHARFITPESLATAKRMIAEGIVPAEAARAIGCTPGGLYAALAREANPRPRKKKFKPVEFESIRLSKLDEHIGFNNRHLSTLQLRQNL